MYIYIYIVLLHRLKENQDLLSKRLMAYRDSKNSLDDNLKEQAKNNRTLVADMSDMKPEIKRLYKLREQYRRYGIQAPRAVQKVRYTSSESSTEGTVYKLREQYRRYGIQAPRAVQKVRYTSSESSTEGTVYKLREQYRRYGVQVGFSQTGRIRAK